MPPPATGPREVLVTFGTRIVAEMLRPDVVAVIRGVIASTDAPEAARRFWAVGPGQLRRGMRAWLALGHAAGRLHVPDPDAASRLLPEMMRGGLLLEVLLGARETVRADKIRRQVEAAVDLFLATARPPG